MGYLLFRFQIMGYKFPDSSKQIELNHKILRENHYSRVEVLLTFHQLTYHQALAQAYTMWALYNNYHSRYLRNRQNQQSRNQHAWTDSTEDDQQSDIDARYIDAHDYEDDDAYGLEDAAEEAVYESNSCGFGEGSLKIENGNMIIEGKALR